MLYFFEEHIWFDFVKQNKKIGMDHIHYSVNM